MGRYWRVFLEGEGILWVSRYTQYARFDRQQQMMFEEDFYG